MPLILVAGAAPNAGTTTVAAGLAHRLAYAGHAVRLARLEGDRRAAADAATFAAADFAEAAGVPEGIDTVRAHGGLVVAEAPAGADAAALAAQLGARLVIVGASGTAVPAGATLIVNRARHAGPLALPEDRLLAGPSVGALIAASGARVLVRSQDGERAVCEHVVIGAVASDSDEPYFRSFERPAIVTRAERVDIALSALRADPVCLILSGGGEPSPYILDRVGAARTTTLLLTAGGTVETMRDLERTFGADAFAGDAKWERAGALIAAAIDDAALAGLIGA